jgi:hypothetical protein
MTAAAAGGCVGGREGPRRSCHLRFVPGWMIRSGRMVPAPLASAAGAATVRDGESGGRHPSHSESGPCVAR